jgi:16S rRNA processing protein RimM
MTENQLIQLGACKNPHGIKGGFSLFLFNTEESVLSQGTQVTLKGEQGSSLSGDGQEFTIDKIQFGNKVICYFAGITDRNTVEAMLPFTLWVDRSTFPETKEGEYYLTDMGVLKECYHNGEQTVFVIETPNGEIDLPFVENFFPFIDMENGVVEIIFPEYLEGEDG